MMRIKICCGVLLYAIASMSQATRPQAAAPAPAAKTSAVSMAPAATTWQLPDSPGAAMALLSLVVLVGGRIGKEPGGWRLGGQHWWAI